MDRNKKTYAVISAMSLSLASVVCSALPVWAAHAINIPRSFGSFGNHGNFSAHNQFNAGQQFFRQNSSQFGNQIGRNYGGQRSIFSGASHPWGNGQAYGGQGFQQAYNGRWNNGQQFFREHPNQYGYTGQNFSGQNGYGGQWGRPNYGRPGFQQANNGQYNGSQPWNRSDERRFLGRDHNALQDQNNLNGNNSLLGQNRFDHQPQMASARPSGTYFSAQPGQQFN